MVAHATSKVETSLMTLASVTSILMRAAAHVAHRARRRADRKRLDAMPDHILKDLGIQRCAIGYLCDDRAH
jgi:uncharacterized protein YjiS (DUF1127 family)